MRFNEWLMQFEKKDNPLGDLARDVRHDNYVPNEDNLRDWENHLIRRNACSDALKTLIAAFKKWKKSSAMTPANKN